MLRLGCLLIIIVIAVGGYWAYEHASKDEEGLSVAVAMSDVRERIEKAQSLLDRHKLVEAQTELAAALKSLDSVEEFSDNLTDRAAQMWGTTRAKAQAALKKAETYVLEGSKPGSGSRLTNRPAREEVEGR